MDHLLFSLLLSLLLSLLFPLRFFTSSQRSLFSPLCLFLGLITTFNVGKTCLSGAPGIYPSFAQPGCTPRPTLYLAARPHLDYCPLGLYCWHPGYALLHAPHRSLSPPGARVRPRLSPSLPFHPSSTRSFSPRYFSPLIFFSSLFFYKVPQICQ